MPFLDYRIIEMLFKVHKNLKLKGQLNKIILRNAVANNSLPQELLNAPKRGFSVPLREWFKQENLYNDIKQMLLAKKGNLILDQTRIASLLDQNNQGHLDAGNFLWMLLVLKKWNDVNQQPRSVS
jgi:asparagine synthase (glutamine-hydrolysing)